MATVHAIRSGEHRIRPPANFRFEAFAGAQQETNGAITLRVEQGKSYRLHAALA
jgi:hypothetical protein